MIHWSERQKLNFKNDPNVLQTPKKRQYPERNLHYVSNNSVLLPEINSNNISINDLSFNGKGQGVNRLGAGISNQRSINNIRNQQTYQSPMKSRNDVIKPNEIEVTPQFKQLMEQTQPAGLSRNDFAMTFNTRRQLNLGSQIINQREKFPNYNILQGLKRHQLDNDRSVDNIKQSLKQGQHYINKLQQDYKREISLSQLRPNGTANLLKFNNQIYELPSYDLQGNQPYGAAPSGLGEQRDYIVKLNPYYDYSADAKYQELKNKADQSSIQNQSLRAEEQNQGCYQDQNFNGKHSRNLIARRNSELIKGILNDSQNIKQQEMNRKLNQTMMEDKTDYTFNQGLVKGYIDIQDQEMDTEASTLNKTLENSLDTQKQTSPPKVSNGNDSLISKAAEQSINQNSIDRGNIIGHSSQIQFDDQTQTHNDSQQNLQINNSRRQLGNQLEEINDPFYIEQQRRLAKLRQAQMKQDQIFQQHLQ
ncbi:UNKNOWN [Stylonychia lemnae]|uniref:Uncharacterized protein n=1 Tax=Stylonychia lemnae TaxID=5949 RepID=A0A078B866_STYLE|nr:UNKNOWN [Stylonychia lemnae]|eukprot:CDW89763.1 UNKNOWN [Stylonychia lemnae]